MMMNGSAVSGSKDLAPLWSNHGPVMPQHRGDDENQSLRSDHSTSLALSSSRVPSRSRQQQHHQHHQQTSSKSNGRGSGHRSHRFVFFYSILYYIIA